MASVYDTVVAAIKTALDAVYVKKSSTSGLLKNDGTVDTTSYSDSTHTHGNINNNGTITGSASSNTLTTFCGISNNVIYKANKFNANNVIDTTAHSNLGTSANATQKDINTAIDSLIGSAITYINGSGN